VTIVGVAGHDGRAERDVGAKPQWDLELQLAAWPLALGGQWGLDDAAGQCSALKRQILITKATVPGCLKPEAFATFPALFAPSKANTR
jgi:hypothetical protein